MSDEDDFDDFDEDSGEGDFSASEDEWVPGKNDKSSESDFEETPDTGADDSIVERGKKKKLVKEKKTAKTATATRTNKRLSISLRTKLYNKYKPPPKTVAKPTFSSASAAMGATSSITAIKEFSKRKADSDSDSSDSDSDNFVNPNDLDLSSEFFTKTTATEGDTAPNFDCNAGIALGTSGSDDDDDDVEVDKSKNQNSSTSSNDDGGLNRFQQYNDNLEKAKSQLAKAKFTLPVDTNKSIDVTKLLSMGEASTVDTKPVPKERKNKRKKNEDESEDSDWEDVEDVADAGVPSTKVRDVQVTVGGEALPRKAKRSTQEEMELVLKRRINRRKREIQVTMHKVHVMAWIGYGNYASRVLNNLSLMNIASKLLPSKQSYPDGPSCEKYFESLVKWYKTKVLLKSKKTYSDLSRLPPLATSLALQIRGSHAICYKDYVLIFVCLLRAMGQQCRLVMNFQTVARKPAQSELLSLTVKESETKDNTSKKQQVDGKNPKGSDKSKTSGNGAKVDSKSHKIGECSKSSSSHSMSTTTLKENKSKENKPKDKEPGARRHARECKTKLSDKPSLPENKKITLPVGKSSSRTDELSPEKSSRSGISLKEKLKPQKCSIKISKMSVEKINELTKTPPKKPVVSLFDTPESTTKHLKRIPGKIDSPVFSNRKLNMDDSKQNVSKAGSKRSPSSVIDKHTGPTSPKMSKRKIDPDASQDSPRSRRNLPSTTNGSGSNTALKRAASTQEEHAKPKTAKQSDVLRSPKMTRHRLAERNKANENNQKASDVPSKRIKALPAIPQLDGAGDIKKRSTRNTKKTIRPSTSLDEDDSDSDFERTTRKRCPTPVQNLMKRSRNRLSTPARLAERLKPIDRRVLSDDEDNENSAMKVNKNATNFWPEVYCEKEQKWIAVDLLKAKVNAVENITKTASKPLMYIFAWNNNNKMRDVTPRYNKQIVSMHKARIEMDWLEDTLEPFIEPRNSFNMIEDTEFNKVTMEQPLPTAISEYKNHPLYVLERHLLKFEGLYPPNAPTLGFVRKEPVYARECVHVMHSREIWVKQARVVKLGETPYKIVKSRPKWDRANNKMLECQPLEIFGYWQTKPYEPPVAENGIVPRNPYGNVELFKPEMLPIGTRHLQLPGLQRTCKKMNVDCAQAVVGFDFHSGASHPTFDGFVVCEEFADAVLEQWWKDQQEADLKEKEKVQARVWGNWKKLIKGLFIRERLKRKFNFNNEPDNGGASTSSGVSKKKK